MSHLILRIFVYLLSRDLTRTGTVCALYKDKSFGIVLKNVKISDGDRNPKRDQIIWASLLKITNISDDVITFCDQNKLYFFILVQRVNCAGTCKGRTNLEFGKQTLSSDNFVG